MCNRAFSLIELLVVLAIVAILAAVAVPAYNTYTVKARVLELLNVAQTYKVKLVEQLFDGETADQEITLDSNTIDKIHIRFAASDPNLHVIDVVAKMQDAQHSGIGIAMQDAPLILQLQGREGTDILTWTCHVAAHYNKYVPSQCRNNDLI